MRYPVVIPGKARRRRRKVDERRIGIADQSVVARVFHHDDEHVIKAVSIIAARN